MNIGVAISARLGRGRLIISQCHVRSGSGIGRRKMAGLTDGINVRAPQKMGIGATVRKVARRAALGLDDCVLKREWAGNAAVAVRAEGVLASGEGVCLFS